MLMLRGSVCLHNVKMALHSTKVGHKYDAIYDPSRIPNPADNKFDNDWALLLTYLVGLDFTWQFQGA